MSDFREILNQEIAALAAKIEQGELPEEMRYQLKKEIIALQRSVELGSYDEKYEKVSHYIDWCLRLPFGKKTEDTLDIQKAKEIFDQHHFGMQEVKDRFLEYLAVLNLQKNNIKDEEFSAPILLLVGLVGTGKTTFAYSLAEALGRKLVRIPFGGMGSAKELRGNSRLLLGSEPGKVIKGVCESGVMNPIILLDEIDRSADDANMDIMGVLVELLDPAQNHAYTDDFINYPVDLSQAIFLATANNTRKIATAVMDRMEKITMPSYTDEEKVAIAKKYVMPKVLEEVGLRADQFIIREEMWTKMVRPLGFDAGIRTLQRTIQGAARKAARIIVESKYDKVEIGPDNYKIFLPSY
jgi:ATP-dependent Lon protease